MLYVPHLAHCWFLWGFFFPFWKMWVLQRKINSRSSRGVARCLYLSVFRFQSKLRVAWTTLNSKQINKLYVLGNADNSSTSSTSFRFITASHGWYLICTYQLYFLKNKKISLLAFPQMRPWLAVTKDALNASHSVMDVVFVRPVSFISRSLALKIQTSQGITARSVGDVAKPNKPAISTPPVRIYTCIR